MRGSMGTWSCAAVAFTLLAGGCGDDDEGTPDTGVDDGGTFDGRTPDGGPADAGIDGGPDAGPARLDPTTIPQFVTPLVIPPAMVPESRTAARTDYVIAVRQFDQPVLPDGYPETTVWGYGRPTDPASFNYPAFTIEARTGETVRVEWINDLVDETGAFRPHFLPVDQTVRWANPAGPPDSETDIRAHYRGPVPIVAHLHGGHIPSVSDGNPEAWYLPAAIDIPTDYATRGPQYGSVAAAAEGSAIFEYPLDQRAATIWYHDHAMGITRLNVYAGMAGFFLIRDDVEDALDLPGPAPAVGDAAGTSYYEIPIVVQDRSFYEDGSLFYPMSRTFFDGFEGPYVPESEVPPTWNPEFFGDVMVVNGRSWPYLDVEARLYRFRFLNGSNSRFLILKPDRDGLVFHQIGTDGGLMSGAPVDRTELLLGPGERADVLVDFSALTPGDEVVLLNVGPDEPFKGPLVDQDPASPETTGRVMRFRVVADSGRGNAGAVPTTLPTIAPLTTAIAPRDVTLNEIVYLPADVPAEAELGTGTGGPLDFSAPITETPMLGSTEIWRIANLTEDAHPIHLHLVTFQVLDRIPFDAETYAAAQAAFLAGTGPEPVLADHFTGSPIAPEPSEAGWKDTVIANPGEVTRIIATYDMAGLYVWHCHILEHEDNEMMRPYRVVEP